MCRCVCWPCVYLESCHQFVCGRWRQGGLRAQHYHRLTLRAATSLSVGVGGRMDWEPNTITGLPRELPPVCLWTLEAGWTESPTLSPAYLESCHQFVCGLWRQDGLRAQHYHRLTSRATTSLSVGVGGRVDWEPNTITGLPRELPPVCLWALEAGWTESPTLSPAYLESCHQFVCGRWRQGRLRAQHYHRLLGPGQDLDAFLHCAQ